MEKTQIKPVQPYRHFVAHHFQFNEEWADEYTSCAAHDIACLERCAMPLCTVLGLHGGKVANFFDVLQDSKWELSVYVFRNNEEMDAWADEFGRHRIRFIARVTNKK